MELYRRTFLQGSATSLLGVMGLTGCSNTSSSSTSTSPTSSVSLTFNHKTWNYDATNDVYWQVGKYYVSKPAATEYETLSVFVPGAYLKGTKNSDGTYAAVVNTSAKVGGYTSRTAPIVFPVNTPGYAAQKPLTSYSYTDVSSYLKAGFVYVHAGLRGKDSNTSSYTGNAPWGVTDLKASVRYVRYNSDVIPGSKDDMFVFGHSGGGAQSAIMGASGDSDLFTPYLKNLGAAMKDANGKSISDAIAGAMCWCPITSLDYANEAYEWNMGQFSSSDTRASGTWTAAYSKDLAEAFAGYQNKLKLKDSAGRRLTLDQTGTGVFLAGSYYDYLVQVINESLNNFLSDTTFPYTPSNTSMPGMGTGSGAPSGGTPPSGGSAPTGAGTATGTSPSSSSSSSTTYKTVQAYIDHLNSTGTWVTYDAATNTAKVTSLEGFVTSQKSASKGVGAFDGPDRSRTENVVFGSGTNGLHFDPTSKKIITANASTYAKLSGWDSSYAASAYVSDFKKADTVGKDVQYRLKTYNPMYYLSSYYDGYKSGTVAPHWRIRTGIMQGDAANTTEVNLVLALQNYGIRNVDFATVWGQGHTMAERSGDATANLITWVKESAAQ